MSQRLIDLHTHTIHSDGSDTPEELIARAANCEASAIAVTDHDTVSGLREARTAADRYGIEFVDGIEISAEYNPGTMHILGYFIESDLIEWELLELKSAREERNPQIAARLQALGYNVQYDEVLSLAGGQIVGRPHFARVLVEKGYSTSIQHAFDTLLGKGCPAYVEKTRLSPAKAIDLIHRSGGAAVLAHPYQLRLPSFTAADETIGGLVQQGLDGLEALYSRHSEEERLAYGEIAQRHGLAITGGSDYHGTYKPDLNVLTGKGDLRVPYALLEELRARAYSHRTQER
jgi:predicted metal-dependent phosphoesterase TrpH